MALSSTTSTTKRGALGAGGNKEEEEAYWLAKEDASVRQPWSSVRDGGSIGAIEEDAVGIELPRSIGRAIIIENVSRGARVC